MSKPMERHGKIWNDMEQWHENPSKLNIFKHLQTSRHVKTISARNVKLITMKRTVIHDVCRH
jgi:hypothetical protein